ncbi:gamma-glutamylcyclotransferase [Favolaschia claudopus]|uniref:glutathione-specific gamma-glutamylcyclotransferase n=1 Tax=Favolaschia claudopus TaxID=2862362 RepID=A0AAW0BPG5_9AGAR
MSTPFVVFGYGSLIFKPPPNVVAQAPGFLKGYVRRFAQESHDHREPGRVVTLVHKEDWDLFSNADPFPDEDTVWGIAYTIDPEFEADDGYTMETIPIYNIVDGVETVIFSSCYVGRKDNPSFIGSEPLPALANRIWLSVGPSGPNKEYLYNLANAVRELSPESYDKHLFALEELVKALDEKNRSSVPPLA